MSTPFSYSARFACYGCVQSWQRSSAITVGQYFLLIVFFIIALFAVAGWLGRWIRKAAQASTASLVSNLRDRLLIL